MKEIFPVERDARAIDHACAALMRTTRTCTTSIRLGSGTIGWHVPAVVALAACGVGRVERRNGPRGCAPAGVVRWSVGVGEGRHGTTRSGSRAIDG